MERTLFELRIKAIKEETANTKSFVLESTTDQVISYQSGQFLTLIFNYKDNKEVRRSYSISSSPILNEPLTITVKKIPNGEYSRALIDYAKVGDKLYSIGASGLFTLPKKKIGTYNFCFLAAGSGITPIFSQIKTLLYASNCSILLIYSNRNAVSTIFFQELLDLKEKFENRLSIEFLFSESAAIAESRLTQYVLDSLAAKHALYTHQDTLFYLCGPYSYMRMISIQLRTEGIASDKIKKELFVVNVPPLKLPKPPDEEKHTVTIRMGKQNFQLQVQYPESILMAAKKQQIELPYSCENGQCGTCAAICTKGRVWMRYNEVLGEKAIAEGYILTCTGYPIYGPVDLKI